MIALPMAPAERAERLTGRPSLSYTSIATYQSCPLKWYFRYVVGLPEERKPASLVFGSAIHAALQRHFEGILVAGRPPPFQDLIEAYQLAWNAEADDVALGVGETCQSLEALAVKILRVFQRSDLALPVGRVQAVEEELIGEISPECPPLLARLDLAVESDDAIVITDFKTARSRWSAMQVEDAATQLFIYHELARSFADERPIRVQFAIFTKCREPQVDVLRVETSPQQIERVRRIVERVWNAIDSEHFYPAPSLMTCTGCAHRGACRTWC